jgi:hypothetical protein
MRLGESIDAATARWEVEVKQHRAVKSRHDTLCKRLDDLKKQIAAAEQERLDRMVQAHQAGLSYAVIAKAAGISKSRVHQLLQAHSADPTA